MFLWIAQHLGFPGVLNLFRYITFRAGAATATALFLGLLIGPKFIGWLRVRQGKGQPIREDGPAEPSRQARHADHGRADDPHLALGGDAAVDGPHQPLPLGLHAGHAWLRPDRLPRRLRQGHQAQPQGRLGAAAAARRIRHRRHRLHDHHLGRGDRALHSFLEGAGGRSRLLLSRLRRLRRRRLRQCGESDRRAGRPCDDAGDHRRLAFLIIAYLVGNAKFAAYLGIPHVLGPAS